MRWVRLLVIFLYLNGVAFYEARASHDEACTLDLEVSRNAKG